jgi:hypothetical protein
MTFLQATDEHRSNTDVKSEPEKSVVIFVNLWLSLFLVPLQDYALHDSGDHSVILNEVKDLAQAD